MASTIGKTNKLFFESWSDFESLLRDLHHSVKYIRFYFLILLAKLILDNFINLSQRLSQPRVKVIFDRIISSKSDKTYFPPNLEPIMAHLFPNSLCS